MSERLEMLSVEDAIETAKGVGLRESMAKGNAYRSLRNYHQLARGVKELLNREEERRVGTEGRSRWSPYY